MIYTIYVVATTACNMRCKHCYNESGNSDNEIDIKALFRLFEGAAAMGVDGISISGGEPDQVPVKELQGVVCHLCSV